MTHNKPNTHQQHRAGLMRSLWIAFMTILYTANTCIQSTTRAITGTSSRTWVDQTIQRWVRRMLKLFRVDCQVYNPSNTVPIPGQPTIIMCNHSSLFDIPLSYCAFPDLSIRMLAKKEMARIPLMKQGMISAEFPFIDRHNRQQAIRDLEQVHRLLKSGIIMWIAPEGTRGRDGRVGSFKKGGFITAIQAQATIIPIGIRGAFDIIPAHTWRFHLNQRAEVHIGTPIDASAYTLDNKDDLMNTVHQAIKTLAGDD